MRCACHSRDPPRALSLAAAAALNAPNIPKKNFTALTRLDMNRGLSQLAAKLHVGVGDVRNLIIWGNHSGTMVVDISKAELTLPDGSRTSAHARVNDEKWVREEFTPTVRKRGAAVIKARGESRRRGFSPGRC